MTAQLMQDYRLASPIAGGSQYAPVFHDGAPELYTIGNNQALYDIFMDPTSDTGWNVRQVSTPNPEIAFLAAGSAPGGGMVAFIVDTAGEIWQTTGYYDGFTQMPNTSVVPPNNQIAVAGLSVGHDGQGNPFPVLLDVRGWVFVAFDGEWHPVGTSTNPIYGWSAAFCPYSGHDSSVYPGAFVSMNNVWNLGDRGVMAVVYDPAETGMDTGAAIIGEYSKVAAARNGTGYDEPFAIGASDLALYWLSLPDPSTLAYVPVNLSVDTAISAVAGGTHGQGLLEAFAISTVGYLYHIRQDPQSDSGWAPFVQLDQELNFTDVRVSSNPGGFSDVFALTTDDDLYHVWQAPESTDWQFDLVDMPTRGDLEEFSSYNVHMTVYDTSGAPAPNAAVTISSDDPVSLEINGSTAYLGAGVPWQGQSNDAGQVMASMKTATLGVPALKVWTAFMPPNDVVSVDPSGPTSDTLASVDAQSLLAATTVDSQGNVTPLLQGVNQNPETVSSIVSAVTTAMSYAAPPPETAPATDAAVTTRRFPARRTDPRVARYVANHDGGRVGRIRVPAGAEPHWMVDFSSGTPVFRTLTDEEAAAHRAQAEQLPTAASLFGWDVDWGDVLDAVSDGIAAVYSFAVDVVDVVTHAVEATVTLVIRGVQYAFQAIIGLAEQCFDLVQEVFANIGVGFDQLFGWLGFVFDWGDIVRTHECFMWAWGQMNLFQQTALTAVGTAVSGFFADIEGQVESAFQDAINGVMGNDSLVNMQSAEQPTRPASIEIADHNIVLAGFVNNVAASTPASVAGSVGDSTPAVLTVVEPQATTFEADAAFGRAQSYFESAFDSPDTFFQSAIAGLLSVAEGGALVTLRLADSVISSLLGAVATGLDGVDAVMTETWDIPLVSDLYAWATDGATLSAADLGALMTAFPATTIYKIVWGSAPFPDDDAVADFKANFTAEYLLEQVGLGPASTTAAVSADATFWGTVKNIFGLAASVQMFAYGALETIVDYQALSPATPEGTGAEIWNIGAKASLGALATEFWGQVFSVPWIGAPKGGVGCSNGTDLDNLIWIVQWVEVGIDGAFFLSEKKLARIAEIGGCVVSVMWGLSHAALFIYRLISFGSKSAADTTQRVLTFIPEIAKFALLPPVKAFTENGSVLVLLLVDIVGDETAAVISVVRLLTGGSSTPELP